MGPRKIPLTGPVVGALASPLRQDILVVLEGSAPLSVADLARRIGKRPDTLYHHLRILQRVGLVREERRPSTGGRPGSVWRLKSAYVRATTSRDGSTRASDVERVVGTLARSGLRDFCRALRRSLADGLPTPRGARACGWMTPRERDRFERRLMRLFDDLRSRAPRADRAPYVFTSLFSRAAGDTPEPTRSGRPRGRGARG